MPRVVFLGCENTKKAVTFVSENNRSVVVNVDLISIILCAL